MRRPLLLPRGSGCPPPLLVGILQPRLSRLRFVGGWFFRVFLFRFRVEVFGPPGLIKARVAFAAAWHGLHRELFEDADIAWPPVLDGEPHFGPIVEKVGERCGQSAYFCNAMWPAGECDPDGNDWQFYDCQMQLPWKVRMGSSEVVHSPWRTVCPCIAGSSKIIVRKLCHGTLVLRLLNPIECMRIMGWDLDHWKNQVAPWSDNVTPSLVMSLAGNAFSAFAFTPVFSSAVGAVRAAVDAIGADVAGGELAGDRENDVMDDDSCTDSS
jgi:hypothetical protein